MKKTIMTTLSMVLVAGTLIGGTIVNATTNDTNKVKQINNV